MSQRFVQLVLTRVVRGKDTTFVVLQSGDQGAGQVDEDGDFMAWEPIQLKGRLGSIELSNGLPIKEYEVSFTSDGANPVFKALTNELEGIRGLKLKIYLMVQDGVNTFKKILLSTMTYNHRWSITTQGRGVQVVNIGFQNLAKALNRNNASYMNSSDFPGDGGNWWDRSAGNLAGKNSWLWVRDG